jgi:hypothetical protein
MARRDLQLGLRPPIWCEGKALTNFGSIRIMRRILSLFVTSIDRVRTREGSALFRPEIIDHLPAIQHLLHQVEWAVIIMIGCLKADRGIVSGDYVLTLG